ncbi:MAG: DUF5103 domain-containing protein [Bacteroidaceae bacterium]|nr:DUF5103 domain-containing protein [Bacteroidaceae bacterium]
MKRVLFLLFFLPGLLAAQVQRIYDENVKTLTVVVDDDATLPPILSLSKRHILSIEWDEMSHDYKRYIYHLQHCNADWEPSVGIFESDFMAGLNNQPVEEYEKSFNTTQIYTHYRLHLPSQQLRPLLSGNYCLQIFNEDDDMSEDMPVLEVQFCMFENVASIRTQVSSNTDIDFNRDHQQVTLAVGYGTLNVVDPQREMKVVVFQNRRWDNRVTGLVPNIRNNAGIEFTHNRSLIFPAGSEFHRFEILDINRTAMGVERMDWFDPYYHATLFADEPQHNYTYTKDQNGVYVLRSSDDVDDATTAEYVVVHFFLQTPRLPGGDVYVCGLWTGEPFNPDCLMEYDERNRQYHAAVLLKQGYYSYQFRQQDGATARTEGDFYQTENEYSVLVYYRGQGERYDRLVGYSTTKTAQ